MILDTLQNAQAYDALHPLFAKAFARLRQLASHGDLPAGRMELDGDDIYAVIVRGAGKKLEEVRTETHQRYIDIQYTVEGSDRIGWLPATACRQPKGYDESKDIEFYGDTPLTWVAVESGHFAVFFPWDAHAPMANTGQAVFKIVIKVAVHSPDSAPR